MSKRPYKNNKDNWMGDHLPQVLPALQDYPLEALKNFP